MNDTEKTLSRIEPNVIGAEPPSFTDDRVLKILKGESIEIVKYSVDTRVVREIWETFVELNPNEKGGLEDSDNQELKDEDEPQEITFQPARCYSLWLETKDPDGQIAKKLHNEILDLIKENLPPEELNTQIHKLIDEKQI